VKREGGVCEEGVFEEREGSVEEYVRREGRGLCQEREGSV
jgi:hypothetical protein